MKKFLTWLIVIVIIALLTIAAAIGYTLTDGFKKSAKPFAIVRNEGYIFNDTTSVTFTAGETFAIKHYGTDKKISAKLLAQRTSEDFSVYVEDCEYVWNTDVAGSEGVDMTEYFDIRIDQDNNTVTICSSLLEGLTKYFSGAAVTLKTPSIPQDIFRLEIETSGTIIALGCRIVAPVTKITVSEGGIII